MDIKLQCRGVDVYYDNGATHAIKDVDLDVPEKVVEAFIGPSGCGKSTLLRALNRMNDTIPNCRTTGTVMLDGRNVLDPSTDVVQLRRQVGMVFQKPNLIPKSIFVNVAYGLRIGGTTPAAELQDRVKSALEQAALWGEVKDRLDQPALGLSGGQQQRVCIARALAVTPEVLLMDEPTSALDPIAAQKIEELVLELQQSYTVVIVTHNMQQAQRVADRTSFFYLGELVEERATSELFEDPQDQRTKDYVSGAFG